MHILIREGEVLVEVSAHDGEVPRICAFRADHVPTEGEPHKSATFNRGEFFEFDDLLEAAVAIVDGVRPQL